MFSMLLSTASNLPANYQLRLVIPAPPDFPDASAQDQHRIRSEPAYVSGGS